MIEQTFDCFEDMSYSHEDLELNDSNDENNNSVNGKETNEKDDFCDSDAEISDDDSHEDCNVFKEILNKQNKRKESLGHDYAVAGWLMSVHPNIYDDAKNATSEDKLYIENIAISLSVMCMTGQLTIGWLVLVQNNMTVFVDKLTRFIQNIQCGTQILVIVVNHTIGMWYTYFVSALSLDMQLVILLQSCFALVHVKDNGVM